MELLDKINSQLNGAALSIDRKYRYVLWRTLSGDVKNSVAFIMCNPSVADENVDDPTIRRCIRLSSVYGHDRLYVINLYNYITPYPCELKKEKNPVGDNLAFNAAVLDFLIRENCDFVCAWGCSANFNGRAEELLTYLSVRTEKIYCFGTNKNGSPKHPLYLPRDARLQSYGLAEEGGAK